jgi:hypothetical protein
MKIIKIGAMLYIDPLMSNEYETNNDKRPLLGIGLGHNRSTVGTDISYVVCS